jgi:hypothetical protein
VVDEVSWLENLGLNRQIQTKGEGPVVMMRLSEWVTTGCSPKHILVFVFVKHQTKQTLERSSTL